jgi:hypothetical protein
VAQADAARPKLVVNIVVDQLRTDYIEYLQSYFGEEGFRRLMRDGVYLRDVEFNTSGLDLASATAMLQTGAYPSHTGVPAATIYDNATGTTRPALTDAKGSTITNDSFTPEGLRLTTVADELAVNSDGASQIYSIAFDPQQAVILAGHAGTSALWINNTSGNWATTSYYGGLPTYASTRNFRQALSQRVDTMTWRPGGSFQKVDWISKNKKITPFKYSFPSSDRNVYQRLSLTPMANVEITDMAIEILRNISHAQSQDAPGMLNIAYTAAPYRYAQGDGRAELADLYLRLDSQLGRLLSAIDQYIGKQNALICITSTGYYNEAVTEDKRYRLPSGEFSTSRAKSLLNTYLSARHGNAGYVGAIRNGQIYLDHRVLEEKHLDETEIIRDSRDFIVKMSGIDAAYTLEQLLTPATDEERAMSRSIDPRYVGDLLLTFTPGWTVNEDESYPTNSRQIRNAAVMTPAIIMGADLKPQTISTPVDATALAPTVAGILRIRAPSGAKSKAIF